MWLSSRCGFFLAALALAGCDLVPVNGANTKFQLLRNTVLVQAPTNRVEFELVRNLEVQLGQAVSKLYDLQYKLSVDEDIVVVSAAQEINRFSLVGLLEYSLVDSGGVVLLTETAKSFTGYSATGTTVATQRSKRDAYDRLMVILAKQVSNSLLILDRS
ncbi:MAG: LPS-assembly lipoprotein [Planktomarina sp.]|jgi:LPS-assembly lipoprotein|tara:strand:- start:146 stop:622 length:477 start_codon:yes stop_codon:yes gene_type:complete